MPLALTALEDSVEKCRETAGALVRMTVDLCQPPHLPSLELWASAVGAITARFAAPATAVVASNSPTEPAEELRLSMVETLHKLVATPFLFEEDISALPRSITDAAEAVVQSLPTMLLDSYPAVKKEAASMTSKLCHLKQSIIPWRERVRQHTSKILKALSANGTHQQSKVRQATIRVSRLAVSGFMSSCLASFRYWHATTGNRRRACVRHQRIHNLCKRVMAAECSEMAV